MKAAIRIVALLSLGISPASGTAQSFTATPLLEVEARGTRTTDIDIPFCGRAVTDRSRRTVIVRSHSHVMAKFYILKGAESPWGDYSDILIAGMSAHSDREGGLIQLKRTGPYVPPISFPGIGDIVVTDAFRRHLESSGITGLQFQPVIKEHIVHLDWHTWDRSLDGPREYPDGGEPEGYLLDRPHSPEISDRIGDLWEVLLPQSAQVQRQGEPSRILLVEASWRGGDLLHAEGVGYIYATEKARAWLEHCAGEHVSFKEASVV